MPFVVGRIADPTRRDDAAWIGWINLDLFAQPTDVGVYYTGVTEKDGLQVRARQDMLAGEALRETPTGRLTR